MVPLDSLRCSTGASDANASAAQQEQTNADTQVQVNKLREQFGHIDEYQAQLEALQVQIPTAPLYPELQQMFSDVAAKYGVVITTLQFGIAAPMAVAAPVDEGTTTDEATPAPSPTPDPSASAAPGDGTTGGGAAATQGLYGIPVSVTILGAYDNVMSALKELQTGTGRLVLVTDVTLTRGLDAAAGTRAVELLTPTPRACTPALCSSSRVPHPPKPIQTLTERVPLRRHHRLRSSLRQPRRFRPSRLI